MEGGQTEREKKRLQDLDTGELIHEYEKQAQGIGLWAPLFPYFFVDLLLEKQ